MNDHDGWEFFSWERFLAGGGSYPIDYSVLSVGVETLGLLLAVEVIRHYIDHLAEDRAFYKTVLEGVYGELATLGIVEAGIFLLHTYYENLNIEMEVVFAKVHFTLFFCTIINAFQSVILALFTFRISDGLWVRVEELDLNNYISIRKEFVKVDQQLALLTGSSTTQSENLEADQPIHLDPESAARVARGCFQTLRYPALKARHTALLVQIRFHRLRVNFLKANNLPVKFKVSDYLVRSQIDVFNKLSRISFLSWIFLMAVLNMAYYFMGMLAWSADSIAAVGEALSYIFIVVCVGFVLTSIALQNKTKAIYAEIMHQREKQDARDGVEQARIIGTPQLDLFWGSNPNHIPSVIQFMQFWYAIFMAILLVFWKEFEPDDGQLQIEAFALIVCVSYICFVGITCQTLPMFTLCTNLGELVSQRRLNETLAKYKLEEAKRKRQAMIEYNSMRDAHVSLLDHLGDDKKMVTNILGKTNDATGMFQVTKDDQGSLKETERMARLAELVEMPSEDLLNMDHNEISEGTGGDDLAAGARRRKDRRKLARKSLSDGVAAMRRMGNNLPKMSGAANDLMDSSEHDENETKQDKPRKKKSSRSHSEGVEAMRHAFSENFKTSQPNKHKQIETALTLDPVVEERLSYRAAQAATSLKPTDNGKSGMNMSLTEYIDTEMLSPSQANSGALSNCEDNKSIDSVATDDESDVDKIEIDRMKQHVLYGKQDLPLLEKICRLYESYNAPLFNTVFGTMPVVFIVGMRVEDMLIAQTVLKDYGTTWQMSIKGTFWTETGFLLAFIVLAIIQITILLQRQTNLKRRQLVIEALLDIFLSGACIGILMYAEAQRICPPGFKEERELASYYDDKGDLPYATISIVCNPFGSRTYGGLGNIEPFTILICLRVFFSYIATKIMSPFESMAEMDTRRRMQRASSVVSYTSGENGFGGDHHTTSIHSIDELTDHAHSHGTKAGTAVDLWKVAVAEHPEIVERYGEFSGKLLEVMLGLDVDVTKEEEEDQVVESEPIPVKQQVEKESVPMTSPEVLTTKNRKLSTLPELAQSVIVAGELGRPVRSASTSSNVKAAMAPIEQTFVVDNERRREELMDNNRDDEYSFLFPDARLIRSMRRCHWRLPPVLDTWSPVDVVVTKFEIIFFEINDAVIVENADVNDDEIRKVEDMRSIRQAISATKGGKGLRLRDVAFGRKIAGKIELKDIEAIHIERKLPHMKSEHGIEEETYSDASHTVLAEEFWKKLDEAKFASANFGHTKRAERWERVVQDRLKISSHQGELYLRFFSDLDHAEAHPTIIKSFENGEVVKNETIKWCLTVARICGDEQLKMRLPHFGWESNEEIMDFMELADKHKESHSWKERRKHAPKRRKSPSKVQVTARDANALWNLEGEEGAKSDGAADGFEVSRRVRFGSTDRPGHERSEDTDGMEQGFVNHPPESFV